MDAFKVDGSCSCYTGNPPCSYCVKGKWQCGECGEGWGTEDEATDCCEPKEPIED